VVQWIHNCEQCGHPVTNPQLREFVTLLVRQNGSTTKAGVNWVTRFLKRRPDIRSKIGRKINHLRVNNTNPDELCRDPPIEFATYMNYLRHLREPSSPDYAYLRDLFGGPFRRSGFEHDHVFDWTIRESERQSVIACQPPLPLVI
jgi:hypothetical protein